jgi:hypothetical protein
MPQVVIPSKGLTLEFPDGMSEKEMADAIDANFPRNGEDVQFELNADPSFGKTISTKDYALLEKYSNGKPWMTAGKVADLVVNAAKGVGQTIAGGVEAAVQEPEKLGYSAAEGFARGGLDLVNLISESTNPASPLFKLKSLLTGAGTEFERAEQFRQAAAAAEYRDQLARGEKAILFDPSQVSAAQAEASSLFLSPDMLAPGIGKIGKVGGMAEKATAAGLRGAGKVLQAGSAAAKGAEAILAGAIEKATGMTAKEAGEVVGKTGIGGIAAGAIGDGLISGTLGAYGAGITGLKTGGIIGEVLQSTGEAMAKGPSRISPLAAAAMDETISPLARNIAGAAQRFGGGLLLDIAPRTVDGLIEGAGIGAVLGALSGGQEGAAQGLGAGAVGGALGATVGRGFQYGLDALGNIKGGMPFQNSIRNERVTGDWQRFLAKVDPAQAERVAVFTSNLADKGFDGRALLVDLNDATGNLNGSMRFIREGELPLNPEGKPIVPETSFKGVHFDPAATGGDRVIYVNVDRATADTPVHELMHMLTKSQVDESFLNNARKYIFGVDGSEISPDLAGTQIQPAMVPKSAVVDFATQYAKTGRNADAFVENARVAYDPNSTVEQRIAAQKFLADEMAAYYAGFKAVGGIKGQYKDVLLKGKIPGILTTAFDLARDATVSKFRRDGAFDFAGRGLEGGFLKDGKPVRLKGMDKIIEDAFSAIRDGSLDVSEPVTLIDPVKIGPDGVAAVNKAFGFDVVDPKTGKINPVLKPKKGKATKAQLEKLKEVISTPATAEEAGVGIGAVTATEDGGFAFTGGLSDAQMEKLVGPEPASDFPQPQQVPQTAPGSPTPEPAKPAATGFSPRQVRVLYQINRMIRDGINQIMNFTYAAETKKPKGIERGPGSKSIPSNAIALSNNQMIPYEIFLNKKGETRVRLLDLGLISKRLNELLRQPKFKSAFPTGLDATEAFIQKYLPNLTKGSEPSAKVLADDNGKFGDLRRNLFYEAMKPPKPDVFANEPEAGYEIKRGDRSVFRTYSLENILSMAPAGGSTSFNDAGYRKLKSNYQPAKVGDKDVFTSGAGARVIEGTRGWRVYRPDGSLEGVYSDLDVAMKKGQKVSASFQPSFDPEAREPLPKGDVTADERLAFYLSQEGIALRRERFANIAAQKAAEFEALLGRPVPSLDPTRVANEASAMDAVIEQSAMDAMARLGLQRQADALQQQTEAAAEASFRSKKAAKPEEVVPPVAPEPTVHQTFQRVIKARKKPVLSIGISSRYFPAAKATEQQLK